MRHLAFFAPLVAVLAIAASANAQSARVSVSIGGNLMDDVESLGEREVQQQVDRLGEVVRRALDRESALAGAQVNLVLTDLKPNRPTFEQLSARPGLDGLRSVSIGGATIEGEIVTTDGARQPVRYDWYSTNLADVRGFGIWYDAERAYSRLGANLVSGRWVTR